MTNLYWLSQIEATEKSLVGDKAFFLSQLLQHDLNTVSGFVVSNYVFQEFLHRLADSSALSDYLSQADLELDTINYQTLQSVASKSVRVVLEAEFPQTLQTKIYKAAEKLQSKYLIIRPSLIVPNYQQEGSLGLIRSQVCLCQPKAIALAIKQVWADLFSAKSLLYWNKLHLDIEQIGLAIVVQPLQNAVASGTVELIPDTKLSSNNEFTNSLSGLQAHIVASWGLGHSIQRGEVDPDRYLVELPNGNVINQQIGLKTIAYRLDPNPTNYSLESLEPYLVAESQQDTAVLKPEQTANLVQLITNIVRHKPQMAYFEWVLLKDNSNQTTSDFYLTQLGCLPSAIDYDLSSRLAQSQPNKVLLYGVAAATGRITAPVYNHHVISHNVSRSGAILVTKNIQPQDIHLLQDVKGIITEIGGQNSHGAIMARELGIPAVVAATDAVKTLNTGDWITLDGDIGNVYSANPSSLASPTNRDSVQYYAHTEHKNVPLATQLMVNLSQPSLIEQAINLPIDGVGLLRGEFMISDLLLERSLKLWLQPDYQEQLLNHLCNKLSKFAVEFAPKPIYYRSLDFPADNQNAHNSVIGNRGTFAYLKNSIFFQTELAAIKKVLATESSNLKLILPFVRSLQEWQFCYSLVQQAGLMNYPNFQLWIMAEVPSIIFLLPEYIAAGVQGVAIGVNDLTQLVLGVDREQNDFARQGLNSNSKAVEMAIAQLVTTAKKYNLPCSICLTTNQQNADFINKLIGWGITMISVESSAVFNTYQAIAKAEKRLLLQKYS